MDQSLIERMDESNVIGMDPTYAGTMEAVVDGGLPGIDALTYSLYLMNPARVFAESVLERMVGSTDCTGMAGAVLQLKDVILAGEPLQYVCMRFGKEAASWMFTSGL